LSSQTMTRRLLALAALVASAGAIPAPNDAALTPSPGEVSAAASKQATGASSVPLEVAVVSNGKPLQVLGESVSMLQASPSPPPVTTPEACTSHDVYRGVLSAVTYTSNLTLTEVNPQDKVSGDEPAQVTVLIVIGILSIALLLFGSTFVKSGLTVTVFLVSFWFIFGIADNLSYDSSQPATFSMCVLPLMLSIMAGALVSVTCLLLISKVEWLTFFLMGACVGTIAMYFIREIILSADPAQADSKAFAFFWLGVAAVAVLGGFLATLMKELIFVVATVAVGSYGFATFIIGLIPVVGGGTLGGGAFVGIMIGAAALGGLFQYMMSKNKQTAKQADGKS